MEEVTWSQDLEIKKTDDDRRLVFGWLSVAVNKSGEQVVDLEDDIIESEDLEEAAYDFMLNARKAGDSHERIEGIGKAVESMVFTKEKQAALGIPEGVLPEAGWWIGFYIEDDAVWKSIKDGIYKGFSIGGRALREAVE